MQSNLSPDLERFRAAVREFFASHLTDELRAARRYMTSVYCDYDSAMAWQRILLKQGWLVPSWPEAYGGTGWSLTERFVFDCESAKAGPPPISPMGIGMLGPALLGHGTEDQQDYYLPRMLRGDDFWCQGYSEPQAGSDLAKLECKAEPASSRSELEVERSSADDYVVNGTKIWTTLGNYARYMILLARTNPDTERKYDGLSFFLAPMQVPGIDTRPIRKLTGEYGFTETFFSDARIPADCLMGAAETAQLGPADGKGAS